MDVLAFRIRFRRWQREERRVAINSSSLRKRQLRDMSDPFSVTDEAFIGVYRLSKELAHELIRDIGDMLPDTQRNTAVPKEIKILCALHFYAQGCYQKPTGKDFDLSVSQPVVSRSIESVTDALNQHLLRRLIKFPDDTDKRGAIIEKNYLATQIPGVLGFIDGTHIAMVAPREHEENFVNRKSFHSLNVQLVCDSDLIILNILARFPGATHDSFIWRASALRRKMEEIYRGGEQCWLLGDSGYPQEPWLHTPVLNAAPGTHEARFTEMHVRARSCVERCIGVLKKRFRCLLRHRTLHYDPVKVGRITNACAILHNMCIMRRLPDPPPLQPQEAAAEELVIAAGHEVPVPENRANDVRGGLLDEGRGVREALMIRMFGPQHQAQV